MSSLVIAGAVTSVAMLAAVASAAPKADTTYRGNTSQHRSASLRTDDDGTAVKGFTITRKFDCGSSSVAGTFQQSGGIMVIKPTGRFWGHDQVKREAGGSIARGQFTIHGRFGPSGNVVEGTYRERVRLKNGTRCDTGEIRFRLKAN